MAFACVKILCFGVILLLRAETSRQQEEDIPHNEVKNWALKFGVDLWEFGRQVTKMNEIQRKYHEVEADVVRKDGLLLIREMAAEVKNMMDFKMNAVMRIMESAEQAAVSAPRDVESPPKYYSSHRLNLFTKDKKIAPGAQEMILTPSRHFDHLPVNVSLSAVLLPFGVKDTDPDVAAGIRWSDYLDPLFANNYESDPSLSWQYFGATSGFLRRFPATSWPTVPTSTPSRSSSVVRDVYDFRNSGWFVGGATSSKDVAILIDNGSYMSGKRRDLAVATAKAILGTLGPDDYVNVYRYAEGVDEIVLCFKDSMVQATPENVRELKVALDAMKPEGTTNASAALSTAFEILHKYNRTGQGSQCNQAIMMITSDTNDVPKELIKRYNSPHMPVRIFVYLVGGEKSPGLRAMACANKGYYARVSNMDEIEEKVFEYIKVLARPMVLYQHDHPIHWTSVYVGGKSNRYGEEGNGQLMTSVTAPILDRRNHTVRVANLLGIVGTDVPVEQIQKLVPPYKLGVNGYSFIVDNNGRILYHPDLRPLPGNIDYDETLRPKYVSVDLSEVELAEHEASSHPLNNSLLLDLRHDMIDQKEGETEFAVKIHYDDMKRVTLRRHKYFYMPIEGTPFSLGLALPEGYGMYELLAEQEIKHAKFNVTDFFKGNNWKVHPDWVYCEYNSGSNKWFASPEDRVFHFLDRTRRPGWKWMSLRPRSPSSHHRQASKPDKDSHYCDKTLVQSLLLDALVTDEFDRKSTHSMRKDDKQSPIAILMALLHSQGKGMFGVTRSFIATRSGLLRWHEHPSQEDVPAVEATNEPHFGDVHRRAMDSSWYKRAVDQHSVEPESFVFSVPFNAADSAKSLVTATHAVFVERKGHRAPAAVVGLQFLHSSLASHFINITSTCTAMTECKKTCASEELDCYILDNNGFIIISERHEHTGKFFGEIDGTIMDSLVQDRIYRNITVVDYQGACLPQRSHYSAAVRTISNSIVKTLASIGGLLWSFAIRVNLYGLWGSVQWTHAEETEPDDEPAYTDYDTNHVESYQPKYSQEAAPETEELPAPPAAGPAPAPAPAPAVPPATHATHASYYAGRRIRACEKKTELYILQPERLNTSGLSNPLKGKLTNCDESGCERPFSVQKIQHTNLILLVVDTTCPCGSKLLSIEPIEALTEPEACTARRERLYRHRPPKCINYHPEEMEIKQCGGSNRVEISVTTLAVVTIVIATVTSQLT
ncbi:voltage-dependent calcium channel subunit alpha-2/delta-4 isoform X1 [Diprion similis]|uniref:voltage-dependent calcium channel subunit alpha-2/delta-4 isoform X1 n=1 Tax=Diprion similis TaxID=362088 RepID=UPI001EF8F5F6|nr:voltage-dependent calcium channel subunit alpha-2/delta-4 isoform X1 [Diprion similis]